MFVDTIGSVHFCASFRSLKCARAEYDTLRRKTSSWYYLVEYFVIRLNAVFVEVMRGQAVWSIFVIILPLFGSPQAVAAEPTLDASLSVSWCAAKEQVQLDFVFGFELSRTKGKDAVAPEPWPLGYSGNVGLGVFGTGEVHCRDVSSCANHPSLSPATRAPAWRIQRTLSSSTLPDSVGIAIWALEKDPSYGRERYWTFTLSAEGAVDSAGCQPLTATWVRPKKN